MKNPDEIYTEDDVVYTNHEDEMKKKMCQFSVDGNDFWPCTKTVKILPASLYKIRRDYNRGLFLRKTDVILNRLVRLDTCPVHQKILDDITNFWKSKEEYVKRGRIYKRNILLYSIPGMGKTSLINLLIEDLVKNRNGMVLSLSENNDILNFSEAMEYIRNSMPNRPVIAVIEDVDKFIGDSVEKEIESELLSILDGIDTFDNIVILCTTNYPEQLSDRYINRPSRFNLIVEYPILSDDTRREFLIKANLKEDLDKINLDEWVKKTKGYTTDFLKELSDCVFINGMDEKDAFSLINKMREQKIIKSESQNDIGFK